MSSTNVTTADPFAASVYHILSRLYEPVAHLRISTKLVAGFSAIATTACLVGVTGLYSIDKINGTLNNITDIAAPTVETSDDLIALIFEANKVAEEIIADEDISEIDLLISELKVLNTEFERTYVELQELVTDESLLDELETARNEQTEFVEHTGQMITAHRSALELEQKSFRFLEAFDEVGSTLTLALDEFAEENETEMAKAEEEGDALTRSGADAAAVNGVLGQLFDQDYPVVEAALKLQRLIIEMQDTAGEYLAEQRPDRLEPVESDFLSLHAAVRPHLEVLENLAETDEDRSDTERLKATLRIWVSIAYGAGQLFETHRARLETATLADELAERLELDADNAVAALDQVAETADAISDGADEAAAHAVTQANTTIFILLVLALLGSLALLGLIVVTVVHPITNLTGAMVSLSEDYGPAMAPMQQSGDEVGRLRAAFDYLENQVQQRTADLQQRTSELDSANRHLEEELLRRQVLEQQLVHAQKLEGLGTLAGGIAHDFNNMLYVILGCAKIALGDLPEGNKVRDLILKIDTAAQRSKSIVNQVLFFSRQEIPNREPLNLAGVVRESVTLLRAGLPSSIILEVDIDDACGIVLADETQIQQLVVNLTTNAFQSHEDGKGKIELSIGRTDVDSAFAGKHLGLRAAPYVRLVVSDQGCGIPEDNLSKIYDPFFTTKPVGEGTGLGLAVVHGIVVSHDGVVVISTEVGKGTAFEVFLPIWDGNPPELQGGPGVHDNPSITET